MKWYLAALLSVVLSGCGDQQAIYLDTGKLTGTSCPGVTYLRGGISLDVDCVAVMVTPTGPVSFPVDKNYSDLIGRNVSAVKVRTGTIVIVAAD